MKIKLIEMRFKLKFVTLFFLFTSNFVFAQNTLDNVGLTSTTPASVAYSLRQLSTTYTGPLVRIKVGTSFYDVYPDASTKKFSLSSKISTSISTYNAAVSGASANALSTIISGATNATVAIWYDQSGNGVHVLSSSATAKIITAGSIVTMNGQPTIKFSSTDSFLSSTSTVNYSSQSGATVNAIAQNEATTSWFGGIVGTADAGGYPGYNITYSSREGYESDGHGCEYGSGVITTDPKMITNIFINSSTNLSKIYVNSVLKTNTAVTTNTCSLFNVSGSIIYIGAARGNSGLTFNGNISEAVIFPKQLIDGERNPLESNQSATYFSPTVTITSSASGAVCAGTSVTFTAVASNISSPTYQWYKNGTAISGANSSTYSSTTLSNNDVIKVSAGDAIVTSSLIQNLDANNATSYSSGNTWTDLTVNGNNGTINTMSSGSVAIATEGTIKSFKYTKGLSYIAAPLSKTASMTFNVWAKTSSLSNYSSGTMLFNAGASGTGALSGGPDLFIAANKIFWNTYDATGNPFKLNGTDITTTTASINDVKWHCFTVVVDAVNNTASLYIDGVFKGVAIYKDPRTYSSTALFIGGEGNNANITNYDLAWDGNISAFQSYSRALSLTEVVQNFNSKAAFFGANSAALNVSNSITASITGSTPALTVTGDGCASKTTLSTTSGLTSYAWYKDNVAINGATSNVYTPTAAGVYKVEVTTGSCSSTSTTTTINTCGNNAYGQMVTLTNSSSLISTEGGANFGTGKDISGKIFNTTNIASTSGTIGSTTAVLGGVISSTTGLTSSVGIIYSTDVNFGTYSTTTIQSNVAAGTYTSTISGLSASTNYFAKSFIVNKAGTSYGDVVSFTTSEGPKTLGQVYGGGIVFYILQPNDFGYDANVQHGLIVSFTNQSDGIRWNNGTDFRVGTSGSIGTGRANTDAIIAGQGGSSTSYAAGLARAYNGGGYTDWYLGSSSEMLKLSGSWDGQSYGSGLCLVCSYLSPITPFTSMSNQYWTSTEADQSLVFRQTVGNPAQYYELKSDLKPVRAIRSF